MKKENKLFLRIFIGVLVIMAIIIINNSKTIKEKIDLRDLKGELFSLNEDDGGWGEWGDNNEENSLNELEDINSEESRSLDLNISEINASEGNVSGEEIIEKDFDSQENIEKRKNKQTTEEKFLSKKTKISLGERDYEFTVGFYISIFLIILVLGIISFWFYSFFRKKN